ncbi:MAG: ABC transporter permease [Acidimicrobiia bacterium]|nr:ABC transporter permease [Acidimicrobiia bacterium]
MVTPLRRKLARDLRRHGAQFTAITVTMFLGVTIFAASFDSFRNLQASYAATATEFHFANLTVNGGDVEGFAASVGSADGVDRVETRSSVDIPFDVGGVKLLGRAIGVPVGDQAEVNTLKVLQGTYLETSETVLVEEHMADHFRLTPGDRFEIFEGSDWRTVTVAGVVSSPEYIWPARDRQELITSPDNFGVIFAAQSQVAAIAGGPNEAIVYYEQGERNDALTAELVDVAQGFGASSSYTRDEQASNAALVEDLRGLEEMAVFFPMLFLTAAAMAAYVMISRLVHTQRPQIGVLLANGFTRRQVLLHYLGYGFAPGLAGALPGAIVGVLLARAITRLYTDLLAIPVTLIQFYPATLVGAVAFGLVASLLAALAPALVASRVVPAQAMRGETPIGGGKRSLLERLIPPLRRLPVPWRMTLRGVGRNPRRTVYTMIGVVLSLMLILVSWGMIDTVRHLMDRQFIEIQQEDATVYFAAPATTSEVTALVDVDGVVAAEPSLTLPAVLRTPTGEYETALNVLADDTAMHRFAAVDGRWIGLPDDGVTLGKAARSLLGVEVGDPVSVVVPGLGTVETTVAAFVDEPMGTMAYVARSHAETLVGFDLPATSALVAYADGVDAAALRAALTARPEVAAFEDAKALYSVMQDFMVLFYAFVGVMLVFGASMAFALIFNAMSVNIAERTREVATLLAVGTDRRRISRLITAENLMVALFGIPLGLVAGYFAAKAALGSFSSDLFAFDLFVAPATYVWSTVAILVVALVSQWPGLRAIRRISIPKIVKERVA